MDDALQTLSIGELAERGGVSRRTVRYYVQRGLIPSPEGAGRGSRYPATALDALLEVKRLQEQGLPLDAIAAGIDTPSPALENTTPSVDLPAAGGPMQQTWTRVRLAPGIELHLAQRRLSPEQLARLSAAVRAVVGDV